MLSIERNSTNRLRFYSLRHRSYSGSNRDCDGIQFKRCIHSKRSQRFLLLPETTGSMVSAWCGSAFNHEKFGLPQAPPVHLSNNDNYLSIIDHSNVPRIQQKSGRGSALVDLRGIFIPTLRIGKIHSRLIHRQVAGKTCRQAKKFCLRLFTESDCPGILFYTHLVPTRFRNRHDYFRGHLHNAFYRRAKKKVFIPFYSGNSSIYSISNSNCRISNSENYRFSQPMGRPIRNRVSGYSILLCLWARRLLGNRIGRKLSKTFSSSRSAYGFHFFSDRGRARVYRNYRDRSLVFNLYLERISNGLQSQRSFRNSFSNRADSFNRFAGFYKPGSRFRSSSHKRIDLTFYKHGRVFNAGNDAFCGSNTKYFRASCKTLMN